MSAAEPLMPAGMVAVSQDEFFALLKADKRDIMPRHSRPDFTTWMVQHGDALWGWSTPGWKNPGGEKHFAVVRSSKATGSAA